MSSSYDDELPDIPGTKFPWMDDDMMMHQEVPRNLQKKTEFLQWRRRRRSTRVPRRSNQWLWTSQVMKTLWNQDHLENPRQLLFQSLLKKS